jgi:hypothetical protein
VIKKKKKKKSPDRRRGGGDSAPSVRPRESSKRSRPPDRTIVARSF